MRMLSTRVGSGGAACTSCGPMDGVAKMDRVAGFVATCVFPCRPFLGWSLRALARTREPILIHIGDGGATDCVRSLTVYRTRVIVNRTLVPTCRRLWRPYRTQGRTTIARCFGIATDVACAPQIGSSDRVNSPETHAIHSRRMGVKRL